LPVRPAADGAPLGIVAFSFGLRPPEQEPNPSNVALARVVQQVARQSARTSLVVAQWEVALQLAADGVAVDAAISGHDTRYLDTGEVWRQARAVLEAGGVREVVPVAQPYLHLGFVRRMVRRDGFVIVEPPPATIPFDRDDANQQWWTKGRARLFVYGVGKELPVLQPILSRLFGPWPV
jgi:hypothetical protein